MEAPPRGGGGSDGCVRCFGTKELAAAFHHSRDVVPAQHVGQRAQKTANSAGARPGVLKNPEPQGGAVTVGYVAAPEPLLVVSSMAGGDAVGILAGMDQKDSYAVHPVMTLRVFPFVQTFLRTTEIPQLLLDKVVYVPVMHVV